MAAVGLEWDPGGGRHGVFIMHFLQFAYGDGDTVIPTAESVVLSRYLREKGVDVHVLVSHIITHAELDRSAALAETLKLISFWAEVLRR